MSSNFTNTLQYQPLFLQWVNQNIQLVQSGLIKMFSWLVVSLIKINGQVDPNYSREKRKVGSIHLEFMLALASLGSTVWVRIFTVLGDGKSISNFSIQRLNLNTLCIGWVILDISLLESDNRISAAKVDFDKLLIFGGVKKNRDFLFTSSCSISMLESRILHDALDRLNSYKIYQGILYAQTDRLKFKRFKNYQWENIDWFYKQFNLW